MFFIAIVTAESYDVISVVNPKWFYLYGSHPEKKDE